MWKKMNYNEKLLFSFLLFICCKILYVIIEISLMLQGQISTMRNNCLGEGRGDSLRHAELLKDKSCLQSSSSGE